ncbi:TIGR04219 family outer membrane beta-barrel protein [Thalassotalea sp. M1531]|uniref:TIGR04219 family outer membrane beta-barrel protein n=1 Tax=Thalassotalea algicola TaxID=2716224 RepID=A0A7Y0Q4U7_9GAMM|nr:TIGR04219 family outer membrane beta-barrel protein [Thalassotalea algicola]NMP30364.1 TIGR04219 family outer membrane beta-barrel protein [Thalassotalea algicola]
MKKTLIAASLISLMSATAQADVVGLYIGGQIWDNEATGAFGETANMQEFRLDDEQQTSFHIAVEHPFPFIPNIKLAQTTLDTTGSATLTEEFKFGDETFTVGSSVDADFDVSYTDYTLYYELFDNGAFSFDFGLTGRDFDSEIVATSTVTTTDSSGGSVTETLTGKQSASEIVPMLYAATEIGLMFTGLNLYAEGNFLSIDDHTLYDYQVGISYDLIDNIAVDVNVTAGYRSVKLELEDLSDLYTDIEFDGVFAGLVIHF